ncbi:shikimate dehydrogenase [Lactococcus nasutitermitis]|uniref:Shikimate dehydrogenase (NADP(+)) n=1 Tax=Lactococcus nasutitermitis TaxID=1652957 RepID=A0ABV9JB89_9LACT|nr:shikimate dehydrogenase [Lactococcus nasutitermitis]
MKIDGYTRMAAVVAKPIKHSLSPFIHNRAFELTGINGVYLAWEIDEEDFGQIISNVRKLNMYGLNISMPYKRLALDYVDYLTDEARLIGAVNTVVNFDGKLIGHNTDGIGLFKSLERFGFSAKNKEITVLGGGGAAIAVLAQACLLGVEKVNVFARHSASFEPLKQRLAELAEATGVKIELCDLGDFADLQEKVNRSNLLVNGTPVGMEEANLPLSSEIKLPEKILVVDLIYKVLETSFLKWAKAQGAVTANGVGMLLYQAAESFEMWTGQKMPVDVLEKELAEKL